MNLDMDVSVSRKVSNDLFWLNTFFKSIVHEISHFSMPVLLARDLRPGSQYMWQ